MTVGSFRPVMLLLLNYNKAKKSRRIKSKEEWWKTTHNVDLLLVYLLASLAIMIADAISMLKISSDAKHGICTK